MRTRGACFGSGCSVVRKFRMEHQSTTSWSLTGGSFRGEALGRTLVSSIRADSWPGHQTSPSGGHEWSRYFRCTTCCVSITTCGSCICPTALRVKSLNRTSSFVTTPWQVLRGVSGRSRHRDCRCHFHSGSPTMVLIPLLVLSFSRLF